MLLMQGTFAAAPTPSNRHIPDAREVGTGGSRSGNSLLHVLTRRAGATIPGSERHPGQTDTRVRSSIVQTTTDPMPTSSSQTTSARRHFHHTGYRISGMKESHHPITRANPLCVSRG